MSTGNKLWNKDFMILWQGQLISDLGNGIFNLVLGFWVLDLTGSKIMMGTILACLSLPRVLLGPFAGAFSDRHSRKWIIVLADGIRGLLFTTVGLLAWLAKGNFPSAVLYPVAIVSGMCSAFFTPAIISAIPDIVPLEHLTKANSLRNFSNSAGSFIGYAIGGILYSLLKSTAGQAGPPDLVMAYGACFLYAAVTQLFMHIPQVQKVLEQKHILREMMDGIKYTFSQAGIRSLIIIGMFLNFFAMMGITLLVPLFKEEPGYGTTMYGAVMATMMAGQLIGMAFVSMLKLKPKHRSLVFYLSVVCLIGCMIPVGLVRNVYLMFPFALIIGMAVAIMTILMYTLLQISVAPENRGKVFGIMSTVFEGLNPVSQSASGFVSEIFGVRPTIVGAFICAAGVLGFAFFNKPFKVFLNSEPAEAISGAGDGNLPQG
jgi:MFS transporter, DHA3 family, macrolide efflux protein